MPHAVVFAAKVPAFPAGVGDAGGVLSQRRDILNFLQP